MFHSSCDGVTAGKMSIFPHVHIYCLVSINVHEVLNVSVPFFFPTWRSSVIHIYSIHTSMSNAVLSEVGDVTSGADIFTPCFHGADRLRLMRSNFYVISMLL